ncbi:hypothetical protein JMJ56_05105 [Belnapia sp. T18]|uniref:Glycine zipper domain-containing protein n=1 Tax=Belnapia arida TaxID=2804533 RepID=A0ABS1TY53_9PROT|nr:hypothetical protein [Belnapia arida]MBL6077376.1 hypothetical protein [Belnapia arida]
MSVPRRLRNHFNAKAFRFVRDGSALAPPPEANGKGMEEHMSWKVIGAAGLALALAACGTNSSDRTTGGAAAGAATGAGIGALGGPVGALAGAAIGAGAGAVTGATTSPRDVNLGTPPWSNPEVRTPLDDNKSTRRSSRRSQSAARRPTSEADRAYMGGGMVGTPTNTGATTGRTMDTTTGTTGSGMGARGDAVPPAGTAPAGNSMNSTTPVR